MNQILMINMWAIATSLKAIKTQALDDVKKQPSSINRGRLEKLYSADIELVDETLKLLEQEK